MANLNKNDKKMIQEAFEMDIQKQNLFKPSIDFKFELGAKVHHTGFGYNAIIMRCIYTEDADSNYNAYDVGLWESNPPCEGQNIAEIYLASGHRAI